MSNIVRIYRTTTILALSLFIAGCQAIADIFQAGVWVGIVLVLIVVGLILFVVRGRR